MDWRPLHHFQPITPFPAHSPAKTTMGTVGIAYTERTYGFASSNASTR